MTRNEKGRGLSLLLTFVILSTLWFATPHAGQEGANEGFILFTSDRANPSSLPICSDCEDIYVMSPDGSSPTRLTFGGADMAVGRAPYNNANADWSHRQKRIAFSSNRGGFPEIFLMHADGSDPLMIASLGGSGAVAPSFSDSGQELCFNSQVRPRDIYIVNIDGTGLTNLTETNAADNLRCDWAPTSNSIAFGSTRDGNEELYVMDADGTDVVRLTGNLAAGQPAAPGTDANPAWSPQGDRIAFESNRHTAPGDPISNAEIYVMNADGTNQLRLTFSVGQDTKPTWSPTGDRIAFHRRIEGHLQVFTMNPDGSDVRAITETIFPEIFFSGFPSWGKWSNNYPPAQTGR
jgi:TolB protein